MVSSLLRKSLISLPCVQHVSAGSTRIMSTTFEKHALAVQASCDIFDEAVGSMRDWSYPSLSCPGAEVVRLRLRMKATGPATCVLLFCTRYDQARSQLLRWVLGPGILGQYSLTVEQLSASLRHREA